MPMMWVVAWWGPGRSGYFTSLERAGRYTEAQARAIEEGANRYRPAGTYYEIAMPDPVAAWRTRAVAFTCPRCGAVSHNPHDIEHRYCARCHVFVDDV